MDYSITCGAQPHAAFSSFFFVFHLGRYRPRSAKGVFASTIRITTNLTSFDIDLLVFDELVATYVSNTLLDSPYGRARRMT